MTIAIADINDHFYLAEKGSHAFYWPTPFFINKAEFLSFYSGMDGLGEIPL